MIAKLIKCKECGTPSGSQKFIGNNLIIAIQLYEFNQEFFCINCLPDDVELDDQ